MGLYKKGQIWWISFSYNGRQLRQSTETDDRKIAEKIHRKVLTEVAEGKWFERQQGTETFAEMMNRYMKEHSAAKKRSTIRDQASLKHLLPFFGTFALREIRPGHISRYKAARLTAKAAPGTLKRELALMKHALTLAMVNIHELRWAFETALQKVGISDFRFHDLRHTLRQGMPRMASICLPYQKLLGHKSYATTERYAHHCTESLRRGINVLDTYVDNLSRDYAEDEVKEKMPDKSITNFHNREKHTGFFRTKNSQSG